MEQSGRDVIRNRESSLKYFHLRATGLFNAESRSPDRYGFGRLMLGVATKIAEHGSVLPVGFALSAMKNCH